MKRIGLNQSVWIGGRSGMIHFPYIIYLKWRADLQRPTQTQTQSLQEKEGEMILVM